MKHENRPNPHPQPRVPRILFICKIRNDFYGPSFGLINSCRFICNALQDQGIECKVVSVNDNNDIDREVHTYQPSHVFIEALWVVPAKFEELIPLHPDVKWYVRIHSKIPFLAGEGMAIEWLREYDRLSKIYPQLHIASNSEDVVETFGIDYGITVGYFPNIYLPPDYPECRDRHHCEHPNHIDIGCFGAIRPMKNQLLQALAAIAFGNAMGMRVHFHINSNRCETGGDPVLRNLVYAFKDLPHKLIYHPWMEHADFIELVRRMDVGMQISMSETFNIVTADFVWSDIPVIGSDEIAWLDKKYQSDANDIGSMVDKLIFAYKGRKHDHQRVNLENLEKYNKRSLKVWLDAI